MSEVGDSLLALLTDDWQPTTAIAEQSNIRHLDRSNVVAHAYHTLAMLEKYGQAESVLIGQNRYWRLRRSP